MPIKNLTDRKTIKPRLPQLGVLRKGAEKPNKGPGKELPYFRFTSENQEIAEAFYIVYGNEPKSINAVLMHETVEDNFPTWIEAWDASGMVFRSDGDNWIIWRDGNSYSKQAKPHTDHSDQFEVGRLEIIIPELLQLGFVGTVTVLTHSNHDLRHISSILLAVEQQRGSLSGTQFVVRRVPQEISIPGWGDRADKRAKAVKHLIRLEAPISMFDAVYINSPNDDKALQLIDGDDAPLHWSKDQNNRQTIESQLSKLKIPLTQFFDANDAKNWDDMIQYEGTGSEALEAVKNHKPKSVDFSKVPELDPLDEAFPRPMPTE